MDLNQIIHNDDYSLLKKAFDAIIKSIPELKFNVKLELFGYYDKLSNPFPNCSTLGTFNSKSSTISIHVQCINQYNKGYKEELLKTIIHELIHASGETNENITEEKTQMLYKKYKSEILSLL